MKRKGRWIRREQRTLVCLLKALRGYRLRIELRNELQITGRVDHVDSWMNMHLSDVICKPVQLPSNKHDKLFVCGKHIRYVHIPDSVDISRLLAEHEKKLQTAKTKHMRKSWHATKTS